MTSAAAEIVKELFGYPCRLSRQSVTGDEINCGECVDCTRDWTPEANCIAAVVLAEVVAELTNSGQDRAALYVQRMTAEEEK